MGDDTSLQGEFREQTLSEDGSVRRTLYGFPWVVLVSCMDSTADDNGMVAGSSETHEEAQT